MDKMLMQTINNMLVKVYASFDQGELKKKESVKELLDITKPTCYRYAKEYNEMVK
ncbi:hypothetical protein [Clostridium vincentii]|uniref:Uncharacterized protein n=1 Tax=Clostridium vincentii TaxID=52704 RepID=A0A2T0BGX6_9CLOT|nr:hypothetical protein [Clostridium vincentii]PRR83108.1 hypothetical protein CLVI_11430 [Clostridium vincentii]